MVICGLKTRMNGSVVTCLNFFFEMHYSLCSHNRFYDSRLCLHRRAHVNDNGDSFPSGHASTDFAIASIIASEYDNFIVPPLAYGIATITALNRISHNDHWSTDVFVGSEIGYLAGKTIVASHRNGNESALSLAPSINGGDLGMVLTYRF